MTIKRKLEEFDIDIYSLFNKIDKTTETNLRDALHSGTPLYFEYSTFNDPKDYTAIVKDDGNIIAEWKG